MDSIHASPKYRGFIAAAAVALLLATAPAARAQDVSIGTDVVSRYVWRGFDFGESAAMQPALAISSGGFQIGVWGSYSLGADGADANQNDIWASYHIELGDAGITIGMRDYYFPAPDGPMFFDSDSHYYEASVGFKLGEAFPLSLYGGFILNGEDAEGASQTPTYLEASLPFYLGDTEMSATVGMVAQPSDFYKTVEAGLVNISIGASREIPVTGSFSIPISVAYILNPSIETKVMMDDDTTKYLKGRSYLVFKMSISN